MNRFTFSGAAGASSLTWRSVASITLRTPPNEDIAPCAMRSSAALTNCDALEVVIVRLLVHRWLAGHPVGLRLELGDEQFGGGDQPARRLERAVHALVEPGPRRGGPIGLRLHECVA